MKTTRKFSFHDFIIYSIVLSSCFLLSGCSSKDDDGKISEQAALIESLQKETVKLIAENKALQQSLAKSRDKIETPSDYKLDNEEIKQLKETNKELKKALAGIVDKREEQVDSDLLNEQMQRLQQENAGLQQENAGLKNALGQENSELYAEVELLRQKNNELEMLLDETVAQIKVLTSLASLKSKREREMEYKEQSKAFIAEFDSGVSPQRKLELIDSLAESAVEQQPSVISIVQQVLGDPDPEIRRAAIALLNDYETGAIIPVISEALESSDEQTRIDALATLANVDDPKVSDLFVESLNDTSKDVRSAALEVLQKQFDDIQLDVLEKGIASPHEDVKFGSLSLLEAKSDHASVETIIAGLSDEDPAFREKVKLTLYLLLDQKFKTEEAALIWWEQNKDKYDENLFKIEGDN